MHIPGFEFLHFIQHVSLDSLNKVIFILSISCWIENETWALSVDTHLETSDVESGLTDFVTDTIAEDHDEARQGWEEQLNIKLILGLGILLKL